MLLLNKEIDFWGKERIKILIYTRWNGEDLEEHIKIAKDFPELLLKILEPMEDRIMILRYISFRIHPHLQSDESRIRGWSYFSKIMKRDFTGNYIWDLYIPLL